LKWIRHPQVSLKINFKEESGVREIEANTEKLLHAFQLIFSREKAAKLRGKDGRIKTINTAEKVLSRILRSEIAGIEIKHIEISPYHNGNTKT